MGGDKALLLLEKARTIEGGPRNAEGTARAARILRSRVAGVAPMDANLRAVPNAKNRFLLNKQSQPIRQGRIAHAILRTTQSRRRTENDWLPTPPGQRYV